MLRLLSIKHWFKDREELSRTIAKLEYALNDTTAKLNYIAASIETVDGTFTFPDGDYVQTKKKKGQETNGAF